MLQLSFISIVSAANMLRMGPCKPMCPSPCSTKNIDEMFEKDDDEVGCYKRLVTEERLSDEEAFKRMFFNQCYNEQVQKKRDEHEEEMEQKGM